LGPISEMNSPSPISRSRSLSTVVSPKRLLTPTRRRYPVLFWRPFPVTGALLMLLAVSPRCWSFVEEVLTCCQRQARAPDMRAHHAAGVGGVTPLHGIQQQAVIY